MFGARRTAATKSQLMLMLMILLLLRLLITIIIIIKLVLPTNDNVKDADFCGYSAEGGAVDGGCSGWRAQVEQQAGHSHRLFRHDLYPRFKMTSHKNNHHQNNNNNNNKSNNMCTYRYTIYIYIYIYMLYNNLSLSLSLYIYIYIHNLFSLSPNARNAEIVLWSSRWACTERYAPSSMVTGRRKTDSMLY